MLYDWFASCLTSPYVIKNDILISFMKYEIGLFIYYKTFNAGIVINSASVTNSSIKVRCWNAFWRRYCVFIFLWLNCQFTMKVYLTKVLNWFIIYNFCYIISPLNSITYSKNKKNIIRLQNAMQKLTL